MDYDVMVVGGGAAGMESALTLGEMGFQVLLVEKESSVGGKMILLSKVFPTLDCASCISTPRMASTAHHPNITTWVYSQIEHIDKNSDGTFKAMVRKKATHVDFAKCTGCQECEFACTVAVPDHFNDDMVAARAAAIAFPQAVPKKAVIERHGSSPCSFSCPTGMKPHGYVSLVRSGLFEEAMEHILKVSPLVGSLGRTCVAPCERECTRSELEGPVPIRMLKRFVADVHYEKHAEPTYGVPEEKKDEKVAIVGSGPAGLTAAYHLAKNGYQVTIFEAEKEAGGMLRIAIPAYRLPNDVLDRDIRNVTALGVEIKTNHRVESVTALKEQGYDAVFLACGAMRDKKMRADGEELDGVVGALGFLIDANTGRGMNLSGKTVVVVGGGNVAIDAARVARRLGAAKVLMQYRRSRAEMPAVDQEVEGAIEEGVEIEYLKVPIRFHGKDGKLATIESISMKLGDPDAGGRRRPAPVEGSEQTMDADLCIVAIGETPELSEFSEKDKLEVTRFNTLKVDSTTLETNVSGVFAGGDAVSGPSTVVEAAHAGMYAAEYIGRYLRGEELPGKPLDQPLPVVSPADVLARQKSYRKYPAPVHHEVPAAERIQDFREVELPLSVEDARESAGRCLDCGGCSECGECVKACPADAIELDMRDEHEEVNIGAVVLSTGYRLVNPNRLTQYGYEKYPNVITGMEMDRLLAPTRPYNTVLRPSDGKVPDNIAYVFCAGSRDRSQDNRLCSRVCCMYSIKHAQLIMGALPLADITMYYIDIRAYGKNYEEFYRQAEAMGTYFVKGKVAHVFEKDDGNLLVTYEDIANGSVETMEHDLVVLATGLIPNTEPFAMFDQDRLKADEFNYVLEPRPNINPGRTSIDGVFVAGTATAAMDIPDTTVHAGAAAAQAASYLTQLKRKAQ